MNLKDYKIINAIFDNLYDASDTFKVYVDDVNAEICNNVLNENIIIQHKKKYYLIHNVSYQDKNKVWSVDATYNIIFKYDYRYNIKDVTLQMNRIRKTEKLLNNS